MATFVVEHHRIPPTDDRLNATTLPDNGPNRNERGKAGQTSGCLTPATTATPRGLTEAYLATESVDSGQVPWCGGVSVLTFAA